MKHKRLPFLLGILSALILGGGGWFLYQHFPSKEAPHNVTRPSQPPPETKEEKKAVCPLDGLLVKEEVANRHPLAVMVENHLEARPQAGLEEASLIYEALTEGGITRFMALYVWGEPEKIGPVRSARTYYLDWATEFNAFYAHVGGNLDALEKIKENKILDLDQFRYGERAYWRSGEKNKSLEHTMFTSAKKLWDLARQNKWEMTGNYPALDFKDDIDKSQRPTNASLTINFSTPAYQVKWNYDPEDNSYKRVQLNAPALKAKNIVVMWLKRRAVTTRIGESSYAMDTIGTGKAKVFRDGTVVEGTWKKENRTARTFFYDTQGNKIQFNRGQTWIEIVHPEIAVSAQ